MDTVPGRNCLVRFRRTYGVRSVPLQWRRGLAVGPAFTHDDLVNLAVRAAHWGRDVKHSSIDELRI